MGKIGDIFREARLGKGLTLEQVADETNISKRFLQGIESDDFSGFPGEVYTLGFIRNYAEFLSLNSSA
ncbi:MAG TPA: helix-turn-helix domain-containing protein, partial [Rectinema sp.]|nr:helix-turn-helix domain-containing protein [Rectinema sp.]HPB07457.1 helix-turn-helix domain-containing protein [Rectinema sp.]HQO45809.1 helix-turn-helix domain-containing protein [Rectinema sp.]